MHESKKVGAEPFYAGVTICKPQSARYNAKTYASVVHHTVHWKMPASSFLCLDNDQLP